MIDFFTLPLVDMFRSTNSLRELIAYIHLRDLVKRRMLSFTDYLKSAIAIELETGEYSIGFDIPNEYCSEYNENTLSTISKLIQEANSEITEVAVEVEEDYEGKKLYDYPPTLYDDSEYCVRIILNINPEASDFTCDYCGHGGKAEDCAENEDGTMFLHDDCVSKWEDENNTIYERRDEQKD